MIIPHHIFHIILHYIIDIIYDLQTSVWTLETFIACWLFQECDYNYITPPYLVISVLFRAVSVKLCPCNCHSVHQSLINTLSYQWKSTTHSCIIFPVFEVMFRSSFTFLGYPLYWSQSLVRLSLFHITTLSVTVTALVLKRAVLTFRREV